MTELTIYDSQGNQYGDGGAGRRNERIKNLFFGGVRVHINYGSTTELTVFFRARESNAGRAEQYYAVYRTRKSRNLFKNFKSELRRHVEREELIIETSGDDLQVFNNLETSTGQVPGTNLDRKIIEKLLKNRTRLRLGVSGVGEALGLVGKYGQNPAQTVAIAENTDINELADCDIAVEIGNYHGLEPLGKTKNVMDQERRQYEGQFVQQKVRSIKQDVNDIRKHTTKSDERIKNRLQRELSVFDSPPPMSSGKSGRFSSVSNLSRPQRAVAVIGLVLAIGALTTGILAVTFLGFSVPFADSIPFIDGDDDDPFAEAIEIDGQSFEDNLTIDSRTVRITGNTSADEVYADLEMDDGGGTNASISIDGSNTDDGNESNETTDGTFELELDLSDIDEGSGNLTVGTGSADDPHKSETRTVTVEYGETASDDDGSDGDVTEDDESDSDKTGDDGSGDNETDDDGTDGAEADDDDDGSDSDEIDDDESDSDETDDDESSDDGTGGDGTNDDNS